jgi:hypothetical protein
MKQLKLEAGKSYKLRLPRFSNIAKAHIDYILDSKVYEDSPLVVYRVWLKQKKYWHQDIAPLWELEIYNK